MNHTIVFLVVVAFLFGQITSAHGRKTNRGETKSAGGADIKDTVVGFVSNHAQDANKSPDEYTADIGKVIIIIYNNFAGIGIVINVAGCLIRGRRRWSVTYTSPRGLGISDFFWNLE